MSKLIWNIIFVLIVIVETSKAQKLPNYIHRDLWISDDNNYLALSEYLLINSLINGNSKLKKNHYMICDDRRVNYQIMVVLLDSIPAQNIDDYGKKIIHSWRIDHDKCAHSIIIVVAVETNEIIIVNKSGELLSDITASFKNEVVRKMKIEFKKKGIVDGLIDGINIIVDKLTTNAHKHQTIIKDNTDYSGWLFLVFVVYMFVFSFIFF